MTARFRSNPAYLRLVQLTIQLHQLMSSGRGETDEAYDVRDQMDQYWSKIDEEELARLNGISADLYSLESDSPLVHHSDPNHYGGVAQQIEEARASNHWSNALALMRTFSSEIGLAKATIFRAICYDRLGEPEVMRLFLLGAIQLDLLRFGAFAINKLQQAGFREECHDIVQRMLQDEHNLNEEARLACGSFYLSDASSNLESIEAAERLFRQVQQQNAERGPAFKRIFEFALHGLLLCHVLLKKKDEALNDLDRLVNLTKDGDYYALRGLLVREEDPERSFADFEESVRLNTYIEWGYFFLASKALHDNNFTRCAALCDRVLSLTLNEHLRAQMYGWLAICYAELGRPENEVLELFDRAITLAPNEDRLRHNRDLYLRIRDLPIGGWNRDNLRLVEPKSSEVAYKFFQTKLLPIAA